MANIKNKNIIENHKLIELAVKQVGKPCIFWSVIHWDRFPAMEQLSKLLNIRVGDLFHNESLLPMDDIVKAIEVCQEMSTAEFRSIYVAAIDPENGTMQTNND